MWHVPSSNHVTGLPGFSYETETTLFCFVLEVGEKNEPNISSGSEDHFSFFPSQSYNEDIDKGFYEKDDFDPSFFDSKTSDKGSKSIEELVS